MFQGSYEMLLCCNSLKTCWQQSCQAVELRWTLKRFSGEVLDCDAVTSINFKLHMSDMSVTDKLEVKFSKTCVTYVFAPTFAANVGIVVKWKERHTKYTETWWTNESWNHNTRKQQLACQRCRKGHKLTIGWNRHVKTSWVASFKTIRHVSSV